MNARVISFPRDARRKVRANIKRGGSAFPANGCNLLTKVDYDRPWLPDYSKFRRADYVVLCRSEREVYRVVPNRFDSECLGVKYAM